MSEEENIESYLKEIQAELTKLDSKVESIETRVPSEIEEIGSVSDFIKDNELAIIDFSAEWCIPCYYYLAPLERMAKESNDVSIGKLDVDEHTQMAKEWFEDEAMAIPLVLSFRNGEIVQRITGSVKGKAHEIIRGMTRRLKVPNEEFQEKLEWVRNIAEAKGWKLNPNEGIRDSLIASLVKDQHCPCKVEEIQENICPCKPVKGKYLGADKMIEKEGRCYCGLFLKDGES